MKCIQTGSLPSLPFDVQMGIVNSMKGLEKARIIKPGYAIEYDYFDPRDLKPTLETKIYFWFVLCGSN